MSLMSDEGQYFFIYLFAIYISSMNWLFISIGHFQLGCPFLMIHRTYLYTLYRFFVSYMQSMSWHFTVRDVFFSNFYLIKCINSLPLYPFLPWNHTNNLLSLKILKFFTFMSLIYMQVFFFNVENQERIELYFIFHMDNQLPQHIYWHNSLKNVV